MLLSCWKNNKEEEQFYAEDNAPIDTTLVDSVVGQTSFRQWILLLKMLKKHLFKTRYH